MNPTLLVLAAGQGTRFGGLKQMEPLGPHGETMLDYALFDALRAGFGRAVFVVGPGFEAAFQARVAVRYASRIEVACVTQRPNDVPPGFSVPPGRTRPWGTLHAVLAARDAVRGPFAVVNADDFYGREAYACIAAFFSARAAGAAGLHRCCMVGYALDRTLSGSGGVNRGICVDSGGFLTGVVEHTDIVAQTDRICQGTDPRGRSVAIPSDALVSMNIWGFPASIFEPMAAYFAHFLRLHGRSMTAECYLPSMLNQQISENLASCRVLHAGGSWFGITHAQDKTHCVQAIQVLVAAGQYGANLWGEPAPAEIRAQ